MLGDNISPTRAQIEWRELGNQVSNLLESLREAYTLIGEALIDDESRSGIQAMPAELHDSLANWHLETGELLGVTE